MTLKRIEKDMEMLLYQITTDLKKAVKGNKAASQRVRINTI